MAKPLAGVRVLEMGTFITGPAAGMLLADLGAEVIKLEQPGTGDPFRAFKGGLYSPHFQTYNRNKQSVELNTKQAEDLEALDELVLRVTEALRSHSPRITLPYCVFNGGTDAWLDIGNKSVGVAALQAYLNIPAANSLHVGDQVRFLRSCCVLLCRVVLFGVVLYGGGVL